MARWILNIQVYDIEIKYIKWVLNHLTLRRNPAGLTDEKIRDLTRPDQILVYGVQLYTDKTVHKELEDLAALQGTDPRLAAIKRDTTTTQQYLLKENVIYCKGDTDRTRWKSVTSLPSSKHFLTCAPHFGIFRCR
jgi:hypothetical protein